MVDSFGGASPLRLNREVPVDVSEIRQAPVAGKVVYPIIYRFFCRISSINSIESQRVKVKVSWSKVKFQNDIFRLWKISTVLGKIVYMIR